MRRSGIPGPLPSELEPVSVDRSSFWAEIGLPVLAITLTGALAVLFLVTCSKVPELESVANRLERRIEEEQHRRLELCRELNAIKTAPDLRQFAAESGLTELDPPADVVTLPPLPPVPTEPSAIYSDSWQSPIRPETDDALAQRPDHADHPF